MNAGWYTFVRGKKVKRFILKGLLIIFVVISVYVVLSGFRNKVLTEDRQKKISDLVHMFSPEKTEVNKTSHHEPVDMGQNSKSNESLTQSYYEQDKVNYERIRKMREKCQEYIYSNKRNPDWNFKPVGHFWNLYDPDLHYCITPKVGCSYWKAILRFISGDYKKSKNILKPSDISRMHTHYDDLSNIKLSINYKQNKNAFTFVRNPYERLWSAYIDKFLLSDFWTSFGPSVREQSFHPQKTKTVVNNITFSEFLQFAVLTAKKSEKFLLKTASTSHWLPIYKLCNPCHTHFTVVGKMETFMADANYILTKFNQNQLIDEHTQDHLWRQVKDITSYNFFLVFGRRTEYQMKSLKTEIARRLWQTFQYNGHIHRQRVFPSGKFTTIEFSTEPSELFLNVVSRVLKEQPTMTNKDRQLQKHQYMVEAYQNVPLTLLKEIQETFKYDFELFDYDPSPLDIFNRV